MAGLEISTEAVLGPPQSQATPKKMAPNGAEGTPAEDQATALIRRVRQALDRRGTPRLTLFHSLDLDGDSRVDKLAIVQLLKAFEPRLDPSVLEQAWQLFDNGTGYATPQSFCWAMDGGCSKTVPSRNRASLKGSHTNNNDDYDLQSAHGSAAWAEYGELAETADGSRHMSDRRRRRASPTRVQVSKHREVISGMPAPLWRESHRSFPSGLAGRSRPRSASMVSQVPTQRPEALSQELRSMSLEWHAGSVAQKPWQHANSKTGWLRAADPTRRPPPKLGPRLRNRAWVPPWNVDEILELNHRPPGWILGPGASRRVHRQTDEEDYSEAGLDGSRQQISESVARGGEGDGDKYMEDGFDSESTSGSGPSADDAAPEALASSNEVASGSPKFRSIALGWASVPAALGRTI